MFHSQHDMNPADGRPDSDPEFSVDSSSEETVDLEELEADRSDPEWQTFLEEARGRRRSLRTQGRIR